METRSICIVGLGGAGCKVVDRLADRVSNGPVVAAVSTDAKSLATCRAMTKVQIGVDHTDGLGTGSDPQLGRRAAEDDVEMIRGLFSGARLVILVAGLGGGTGTGAAAVVLKAAREAGAVTFCFSTLPFQFEGRQRVVQAEKAVPEIQALADVLVLVPNERLCAAAGKEDVGSVFETCDEILCRGVCGVWKLIAEPGYISLDLGDLRKVAAAGGGVCTFAVGEGKGKDRAAAALKNLMTGPLTNKGELLSGAGSLVVSIAGGPDLALSDVGTIMDGIHAVVPESCEVSMGTVVDDELGGKIAVTVLLSEQGVKGQGKGRRVPGKQASKPRPRAQRDKQKRRVLQAKLRLEPSGKGRFKNVEPTVLNGEDLDIPTFIRRRIELEK